MEVDSLLLMSHREPPEMQYRWKYLLTFSLQLYDLFASYLCAVRFVYRRRMENEEPVQTKRGSVSGHC